MRERSPELLGFEQTTISFDPDDLDDLRQFLVLWNDAQQAGSVVHAVREDYTGRLSLWEEINRFWFKG